IELELELELDTLDSEFEFEFDAGRLSPQPRMINFLEAWLPQGGDLCEGLKNRRGRKQPPRSRGCPAGSCSATGCPASAPSRRRCAAETLTISPGAESRWRSTRGSRLRMPSWPGS